MTTRLGALLLLMGSTVATAQVPSTSAQQFEVASVKRNVSGAPGGKIQIPPFGGPVTYINVPLRVLIRDAYQLDAYAEQYKFDPGRYVSIIGSPGASAANLPKFDVQAKPPDNTHPDDRRAMMRALLADRFKLRVRRQTRQMPVYALIVARPGHLGPKLAPSRFDCQPYVAQRNAGRAVEEPVDANGVGWCNPLNENGPMVAGVMVARRAGPVSVLAQRLQTSVDRPILDATGLSGNYEWDLRYAFRPDAPADFPTLFTALQEQLGLKLETRQAPIEALVVDHVELPTAD